MAREDAEKTPPGDPVEFARTLLERTVLGDRTAADDSRLAGRLAGSPASGLPSFGRYADPEPIARGGMGIILRAVDPDLGRPVAIKVIQAAQAGDDAIARFIREARITGQLERRVERSETAWMRLLTG